MIRRLLCWLGWHEWTEIRTLKRWPDDMREAERNLRACLEGYCDVMHECKHCGKIK